MLEPQNSLDYVLDENINSNSENNNLIDGINVKDLNSTLILEDKFDPINQNDLELLIEMGYELKIVKKVYILLKPKDINEAIDFLSQENGIYHHDFMERHGQKDVCFICGAQAKNHINYIPSEKKRGSLLNKIVDDVNIWIHGEENNNFIYNNINNNDEINVLNDKKNGNKKDNEKKNEIFCDLCFEEITKEEKEKNSILCNHLFCSECYLNYFQDKIKSNKVGKITCMQHKCTYEFDEDFIISHLNRDQVLINKYKKFKLKSELLNDPNVKFCPINDCESYARKEGSNKYVKCLEGHAFCFVCSKPWHGKKKCQDEIDKDFKKWKKNKVIKKCPKCKMWTEKNMGCNHMTCAECKYQWCWLCGGKYSEGHYQIGGGCSGLQFSDSELFNNCFCLYLYKLWVLFYQMIILMFIYPIFQFVFISKNMSYELRGCATILGYPICFFACIANLGFYVSIGTVLFIISIFFYCIREAIIEELFDL